MSEIITCPSGLSGRIRGMKVREERVLADRKLAKNGGSGLGVTLDQVLELPTSLTATGSSSGSVSSAGNAGSFL